MTTSTTAISAVCGPNLDPYGVVVLCWTNGLIKIPVAFALRDKEGCAYLQEAGRKFRTKNQLVRLLVWEVVRKGLPFDYLVFDCWYASTENFKLFHRLHIPFVGAARFNRKLGLPFSPFRKPQKQASETSDLEDQEGYRLGWGVSP